MNEMTIATMAILEMVKLGVLWQVSEVRYTAGNMYISLYIIYITGSCVFT
jgi:hypothetical protein